VLEKAGLLDDEPARRPGDVFLPSVYNGRACAVDFAVTCLMQNKYRMLDEDVSVADVYARDVKHGTYDAGFEGTDIQFCAAVVDTFGGWSTEGEELLTLVIGRAACRVAPHNAGQFRAVCWQRLSCSLQRANAQAVLARLQPTEEEADGMWDAL
jgi:hypothetical protein